MGSYFYAGLQDSGAELTAPPSSEDVPFIQSLCASVHTRDLDDTWWASGPTMGSWHLCAKSGRLERCVR